MHWRNSNFQIAYFIAGKCHTADEAYRQLMQLREERDVAIKTAAASVKRAQAKQLRAQAILDDAHSDAAAQLEAAADLDEIEATRQQGQDCYDQALRERTFIDTLIERVKPLRQYASLPDHEAHQAAQLEEWHHELLFRAQNYLTAHGHIPADQLATMRLHPAFETSLLPAIQDGVKALQSGSSPMLTRPGISQVLLDHKTED